MSVIINQTQGAASYSSEVLITHICPTCFICFAIPQRMHEEAKRCTRESSYATVSFCCPNGHSLSYPGENEEERLRQQLDYERRRNGGLSADLEQTKSSLSAQKGAAKRARNERDTAIKKIKAGICPVKGCGRHFKNVERHIASQHPDYDFPHDHD